MTTLLRFRSDTVLHPRDGALRLLSPVGAVAVRGVAPAVITTLRELTEAPAALAECAAKLSPAQAAQLRHIVARVGPLFTKYIHLDGRTLVTVDVTARGAHYEPSTVPVSATLRLSSFALLRSHEGTLVLECPLVRHRVRLVDPAAAALVAMLGAARTSAELTAELAGRLPATAVTTLLEHLLGAGFIEVGQPGTESVAFVSDSDPVLRQWDYHDLLVHSRARSGRFDQPFGGIFPYRGQIPPQPAVKPPPDGPRIALYRPSLEDVLARDPQLTTVIEGRASVRQYAPEPLTVEQLGEFLYRTARVRASFGPSELTPYEATTRPYPCGGAAYELELYLTVQRCADLAAGAYYYDPVGHRLVLLGAEPADRAAMLHTAWVATGMQADPDVLITMTSRFQRLSWKYRAIAYSVSLKHAGVLYQTMYLVATAMGLAPCGLGSGNADLAARTFGLDYLRESSVGEFILGSRPMPAFDAAPVALPEGWQPVNDSQWGEVAQATLRAIRGAGR
jgi:SagB-type dehydrogenase family enzyme